MDLLLPDLQPALTHIRSLTLTTPPPSPQDYNPHLACRITHLCSMDAVRNNRENKALTILQRDTVDQACRLMRRRCEEYMGEGGAAGAGGRVHGAGMRVEAGAGALALVLVLVLGGVLGVWMLMRVSRMGVRDLWMRVFRMGVRDLWPRAWIVGRSGGDGVTTATTTATATATVTAGVHHPRDDDRDDRPTQDKEQLASQAARVEDADVEDKQDEDEDEGDPPSRLHAPELVWGDQSTVVGANEGTPGERSQVMGNGKGNE